MTTGDKLWVDRDSRAEVQLGSTSIQLGSKTGFSFLNLDDHTIQIQLSAGMLSTRIWDLDRDDVFEIDTPNQAFTARQPGRYRIDADEDGDHTTVTIHRGEGESTGNGQSYTMHTGQRFIFSGTSSLNAEVAQIGAPDEFDEWSEHREQRYEDSPSARYVSRDVVGFQDLDENGDWRPTEEYGHVWFPRVEVGWAPYHQGHWTWIEPWGWTWVDDSRWGYAPFHYGRWVTVYGRWGWIPGPREEHPVYAPALVAFVGSFAVGGNVAWFPLGPREVYVPSYHVSQGYVNRVNVSNTTVNVVQVTNVYNTTIVNNNTTINNVTYVNRNVHGAVTAMPQQAFATAQPVAKTAVVVNEHELRTIPVSARAAVPPAPQAVLGVHTNASARVIAPPAAIVSRPVIAKTAPPPPPPSFAARQQILQQHPGVPLPRAEMEKMRPANAPAPLVKQVSPVRPVTPAAVASQPENRQENGHSGNPPAWGRQQPGTGPVMSNRPDQPRGFEPPRNDRPASAQQNYHPETAQPQPNNRPEPARADPARPNQPAAEPHNERPAAAPVDYHPKVAPAVLNNSPEANRVEPVHSNDAPPAPRSDHSPASQSDNHGAEQPHNQPAPHADNTSSSSHSQQNASAQSHVAPPQQQSKQASGKQDDHKNDNKKH